MLNANVLSLNSNKSCLTLAGGDVSGLLLSSNCTKSVMSRNSTGKVAIRLQLMSNETNFKPVTSEMIKPRLIQFFLLFTIIWRNVMI